MGQVRQLQPVLLSHLLKLMPQIGCALMRWVTSSVFPLIQYQLALLALRVVLHGKVMQIQQHQSWWSPHVNQMELGVHQPILMAQQLHILILQLFWIPQLVLSLHVDVLILNFNGHMRIQLEYIIILVMRKELTSSVTNLSWMLQVLVSGLSSQTTLASSSVMVIMLPLPSVLMDFGREILSGVSGATQSLQQAHQYYSNTSSKERNLYSLLWIARELNPFLAI